MEFHTFGTVFILLNGLSYVSGLTATHVAETSLRAALKSGYDPDARPYSPTPVEISYKIRSLQSLDIATQSFSHTAFLNLNWHDPRLVWNASDYGNLNSINIKWAWRPIFVISNGLNSLSQYGTDDSDMRMTVSSNGSVLWQQGLHSTTVCDVDVRNFPYDDQSCDVFLSFVGYAYDTDITLNFTSVILNVYIKNEEWVLEGSSMSLWVNPTCCPQKEVGTIIVTFMFKRLHAFYLNTFLIPTYILSVCLIWPFYVPTESGERLGFTLTILLSYTVILTVTADYLPTTSREVPILAGYLLGVLILCSLAVCNVAINVKIYFLDTDPPQIMKKIYSQIKPIVFLECKRKKSTTEVKVLQDGDKEKPPINDRDLDTENSDSKDEVTWAKISILLDRICFVIYSLAVLCLNVSLISFLQ